MRLRPPNAEVSARCRWNGEQMLRAALVGLHSFPQDNLSQLAGVARVKLVMSPKPSVARVELRVPVSLLNGMVKNIKLDFDAVDILNLLINFTRPKNTNQNFFV